MTPSGVDFCGVQSLSFSILVCFIHPFDSIRTLMRHLCSGGSLIFLLQYPTPEQLASPGYLQYGNVNLHVKAYKYMTWIALGVGTSVLLLVV